MEIFNYITLFDRFLNVTNNFDDAWLIYVNRDLFISIAEKAKDYFQDDILEQIFTLYWNPIIPKGVYILRTIELDWIIAVEPRYFKFYDWKGNETNYISEMESLKVVDLTPEERIDGLLRLLDFFGETWLRHSQEFYDYYQQNTMDSWGFDPSARFLKAETINGLRDVEA